MCENSNHHAMCTCVGARTCVHLAVWVAWSKTNKHAQLDVEDKDDKSNGIGKACEVSSPGGRTCGYAIAKITLGRRFLGVVILFPSVSGLAKNVKNSSWHIVFDRCKHERYTHGDVVE